MHHTPYTLYVYDISYFSGKMQAYLRYKQIPHQVEHATWMQLAHDLVEEAGVMEVPLLRQPDGILLRDTTAMIGHLEQDFPQAPVLGTDPAANFLLTLLEDYADEGLWRPALYYRWAFDTDAALNARRFHQDFLDLPLTHRRWLGKPFRLWQRHYLLNRQRRHYLAGEGISEANRRAVEQHYLDELDDLEALLERRPFLFGDRPSLADFGYFASMFRHFSIDPTPSRLMRDYAPRVYAWVARLWSARTVEYADGQLLSFQALERDEALRRILSRVARLYLPYQLENARAVHFERRSVTVEANGQQWGPMPSIPFRAWNRRRLLQAYRDLPEPARQQLNPLLEQTGVLPLLTCEPHLDPRCPEADLLPFCGERRHLSKGQKWLLTLKGTPHHRAIPSR